MKNPNEMKTHLFSGTGVALVTPFTSDGEIDFDALTKIVNHVITGDVDYLVVMGTTGESAVLTAQERDSVIDHILKVNDGNCPVVLGIGGNNTAAVVEQIEAQDFFGISGILSVSPYYNKPGQRGIYAHFEAISEASPVPVILYNVPGRTGSTIHPETTLSLAEDFKNIVAIKEASGNLNTVTEIIKGKPKDFAVISGDDALTLPMMALGAKGVISVIANGMPARMSSMVKYMLDGDFKSARAIHYDLVDLVEAIFLDGNPSGIKSLLEHLKLAERYVRLPLVPVRRKTEQRIQELCNKLLITQA